MKTLQFKCTLKSDVILNVKASTEGNQESLDFIPGNNFLGIVASSYDDFTAEEQMEIFHSGNVRFGDAHPTFWIQRSLRIPASIYYPKLKKVSEKSYIHHLYSREQDKEQNGEPQQLKQCRTGFYAFSEKEAKPVVVDKSFAIKSAYDSDKRRSEDAKMYGYESINAGAEFFFEVEVDKDSLAKKIEEKLVGTKHIGRSRTAQYGLVKIETVAFLQPSSTSITTMIDGKQFVCVYADSRLIFLDENGQPTFRPEAKDLGFDNGEIKWDKTQIRTFQYAPWNFKRQNRDTDRCGIEKGSVFVVELKGGSSPATSTYVGSYRNEGFGHVIYNPDFLKGKKNTNGEALYSIKGTEQTEEIRGNLCSIGNTSTPLLRYIYAQQRKRDIEDFIYEEVNEFVKDNERKFKGATFASQWGKIRSIAMLCTTCEDIRRELFNHEVTIQREPTPDDPSTSVIKNIAYLAHGVAFAKWKSGGKKQSLENWIKTVSDYRFNDQPVDIVPSAVVNLASEMAKKCREKK